MSLHDIRRTGFHFDGKSNSLRLDVATYDAKVSVYHNGSTPESFIFWSKNGYIWHKMYYGSTARKTFVVVYAGESLWLRGDLRYGTSSKQYRLTIEPNFYGLVPRVTVSGPLAALHENGDPGGSYAYQELFSYNKTVVDAGGLILPAPTGERTFASLFNSCENLEIPPVLPSGATENCYFSAFSKTYNLRYAPTLPLQTAKNCFSYMFRESGITVPPPINQPVLEPYCYSNAFFISSLNTLPSISATNLKAGCLSGAFSRCASIKLAETAGGEYTRPYRIPAVGDATAEANSLNGMFTDTGGTFTGTPLPNTTYYTANEVI